MPRAMNHLGYMYENGLGVSQDDKIAVTLYFLAAEQGHARAQFNLGSMYYEGRGVLQDNVYAIMWWNIAAASGNKKAIDIIDKVAKEMTPADISTAQDLARECVRKEYIGC